MVTNVKQKYRKEILRDVPSQKEAEKIKKMYHMEGVKQVDIDPQKDGKYIVTALFPEE